MTLAQTENLVVLYEFPDYLADVLAVLGEGGWLVHNFDVDDHLESLNPGAYRYNVQFYGSSYTACIDLNVFQFLVNAVKKDTPKELYRTAIAYLAFFQFAGIEVDPTFAVYEKVNHKASRVGEGLEDLDVFHKLNNTPTDRLVRYAIGKEDRIVTDGTQSSRGIGRVGPELIRYRRLKEWRSLYAIVLSVTNIEFDKTISRRKKLGAFVDWSFGSFRLSLPGFIFAISIFGDRRIGRAMKYNPSKPVQQRRAALENMTWDLYCMQQYFRRWVNRTPGAETLFVTNDDAFGRILGLSIEVQKSHSLEPVDEYISGFDQDLFAYVMEPETYPFERVYRSDKWGVEYRDKLVSQLEHGLLGKRS